MLKIQNINTRAAREYLDAHIINSRIEALTLTNNITTKQPKPSIFYFQEKLGSEVNPESISLNVAFRTVGSEIPTTIIFSPESVFEHGTIKSSLFGEKSFKWISKVLAVLDMLTLKTKLPNRSNVDVSRKLKVLSIVMNIITRTLYDSHPSQVKQFLNHVIGDNGKNDAESNAFGSRSLSSTSISETSFDHATLKRLENSRLFKSTTISLLNDIIAAVNTTQVLAVGLPLLLSLWQVFECQIFETVGSEQLRKALINEQITVLSSITTLNTTLYYENFVELTSKRLQVTLFLLCDAIGFDDNLLSKNSATVSNIKILGSKLERLHAGSHDISPTRLERGVNKLNQSLTNSDTLAKTNNTFLYWLNKEKNLGPLEISSLCSSPQGIFSYDNIKPLLTEFWHQLPHHDHNNQIELDFLVGDILEKATEIYTDYYELRWLL